MAVTNSSECNSKFQEKIQTNCVILHCQLTSAIHIRIRFETADGVKREEEGAQKQIGEESGATSRGSWSYSSPEGQNIALTFVADENGFQPQGDHLPVAPEPSPAIKRALAIIARTNAADEARAAGMSTKQKLMMLGLLDQRTRA